MYLYCAPYTHHIDQALTCCDTLGWYQRAIKVDHRSTVGCPPRFKVLESLKLLDSAIEAQQASQQYRPNSFQFIDQFDI